MRLGRAIGFACAAWLLAFAVKAATPTDGREATGPAAPAAAAVAVAPAPRVVANRTLVILRAPLLGMQPADRVVAARQRLDEMLAEPSRPLRVGLQAVPQGVVVNLDGTYGFVVTPGDVDPLAGETAESVAARAASRLEQVVAETREGRDTRAMLRAAAFVVPATIVFVGLILALRWARRSVRARLERVATTSESVKRLGLDHLVRTEWVVSAIRTLVFVAWACLALLVTYEWLSFSMRQFPHTRAWGEELNGFLMRVAHDLGGGVLHAIPNLFVALLIIVIARFVSRAVGRFLHRVETGVATVDWLDRDLARPTRKVATTVVWLFALVMVYPYLPGSQSEAFKGLSVLAGLMVSLGSTSVVGQAASGLILMFTRTFRAGDYVRVGEHEGTVQEIGTFTTRILNGMGEELVLPNSLVLGNVSRNFSRMVRGQGFVLTAEVTIGYDAPWRQVHAMLAEAARRTPGVLADPAARVYQTALSDFYVEYLLVCQAVPSDPAPRAQVISALLANIQDVFNENGVQIMSPHYLADPAAPKVVAKADWYAPPAAREDAQGVSVTRVTGQR